MSVLQYGRRLLDMSPRWLRVDEGYKVLLTIGAHVDRAIDGVNSAIRHGHPGLVNGESLGLIGSDRLLRRGPTEQVMPYADRLRKWRATHRKRGTGQALLEQLRVFMGDTISETRLQYRNGLELVLHTDGTITRGESTFRSHNGVPQQWARWWLQIAGNAVTNANVGPLKQLTREWNAEHTQGRTQIRNDARPWNGSRKWNDPRPWNSPPATTWED